VVCELNPQVMHLEMDNSLVHMDNITFFRSITLTLICETDNISKNISHIHI
jgi:hypothetical protein